MKKVLLFSISVAAAVYCLNGVAVFLLFSMHDWVFVSPTDMSILLPVLIAMVAVRLPSAFLAGLVHLFFGVKRPLHRSAFVLVLANWPPLFFASYNYIDFKYSIIFATLGTSVLVLFVCCYLSLYRCVFARKMGVTNRINIYY